MQLTNNDGLLRDLLWTIRALEEVGALRETDVLEAIEQEPPDTDTKANEGAGVQAEGQAGDARVVA